MELILKNVQEKHLGLIAELARTLKINIEGLTEQMELKTKTLPVQSTKSNHEEGLFLSWIDKK